MKIAVIGATGRLGRSIAAEAALRGHQITPLSRTGVDVTDPDSVAAAIPGRDAVVVAVGGPDRVISRAVPALLAGLPAAGVDRLVFAGGGGSLEYAPGKRIVDAPFFPPEYREVALEHAEALAALRAADTEVRWSYLSPPPVNLVDGDRTGTYRVAAQDTPITDEAGESRITVGDYAAVVVDALEQDAFVKQRFTAGY